MFFVLPEAFIFVGVLQNCFVTTETFLVLVFSFLYTTRTVFSSILFLCSHLGYYWQLFVHQTHYIQTLRAEFKLNWNLVKRWRIHTENWEIRQRPWRIMFTATGVGRSTVMTPELPWVPCCNCTFWDFLFLYLICFWNAERVIACCHVFVEVLCCDSREENQEWNQQRQKTQKRAHKLGK